MGTLILCSLQNALISSWKREGNGENTHDEENTALSLLARLSKENIGRHFSFETVSSHGKVIMVP